MENVRGGEGNQIRHLDDERGEGGGRDGRGGGRGGKTTGPRRQRGNCYEKTKNALRTGRQLTGKGAAGVHEKDLIRRKMSSRKPRGPLEKKRSLQEVGVKSDGSPTRRRGRGPSGERKTGEEN